jgi:hypothetical protein
MTDAVCMAVVPGLASLGTISFYKIDMKDTA